MKWKSAEQRRTYNNNHYAEHKARDPEWHARYVAGVVRRQRIRVHGIIGAPDELPTDQCAFPGCEVKREPGKRGLHADHDPAIKDGSPNFRDWLCKDHNIAVGFYERYAAGCEKYLARFKKGATL